jgi:rod shape-determining protein MreC
MRNLIAFYLRFRLFLVFAILQAIALYTYFTYSDFPRLQMLTTAGTINGKVMEVRNDVTKHFNLSHTNRQLMWENKRLREKLKQSMYREEHGKVTVNDTVFRQQYSYIPADVINNTYDKRNNYMTINVGRQQGIEGGEGVFSSKGVVGTIELVGEHYSVVRTILTSQSNLDVTLEKGGAFGLLKWDGMSPRIISISGISNDIPIKKWSRVVTRGESKLFPRGILVGKVQSRRFIEGRPLWDVRVLLAEDFRTIQHVYVVKNILLQELKDLEAKIPEDKPEDAP